MKFKRYHSIINLFFVSAIVFFISSAALCNELTLRIVKEGGNGNHGLNKPYELFENSLVENGSKIRIKLNIDNTGIVSVKYKNPQGKTETIVDNTELKKNETLLLPDQENWFHLKGGLGKFTFYASNENDVIERSIYVVETREELKKSNVISLSNASKVNVNNVKTAFQFNAPIELISGAKRYNEILSEVEIDEEYILRGSAAQLYKKSSSAVPIIFTDTGSGSGAILNSKGEILTNWHVVGNANEVGVILKPPKGQAIETAPRFTARVIKVDEVADLALIKLKNEPANYSFIPFGGVADVEIAMDVHAIGHPGGGAFWSYTRGTVSQISNGHKWTYADNTVHQADVIQTQTPINPGNSGGPLLNDQGKLIGLNSFSAADKQGINYAVSISEIEKFLKSKQKKRKTKKSNPTKFNQEAYDTNGDGKADVVAIDTDSNGIFDLFVIDENHNGETDYWLIDENGDEKFEARGEEAVLDGKEIIIWYVDTTGNENWDTICADIDKDFNPDRCEPIT